MLCTLLAITRLIMNPTDNMCDAANKTTQQNCSVHRTRNSGTVWTLMSYARDK